MEIENINCYVARDKASRQRGEYDHEFPNSHHVAGKAVYKLILKNNNQLGYLQNWDSEKKKWKEDFYYTKVENSKK